LKFKNLLTADNWAVAKQKLGLPMTTDMRGLIAKARERGYDGLSFKTNHGQEYIALPGHTSEPIPHPPEQQQPSQTPSPTETPTLSAPSKKPGLLSRLLGNAHGKIDTNVPVEPTTPQKQFESPLHSDAVKDFLSGKAKHTLHQGTNSSSKVGDDTLLSAIQKETNRDALPQYVNDATMNHLAKRGWRVGYRGVTDPKHAEQFAKGRIYNGSGLYGNGTYITSAGGKFGHSGAKREASTYGKEIMTLALSPKAKIIETGELTKLKTKFLKELDQNLRNRKISLNDYDRMVEVCANDGRFAALHNFDAIDVPHRGYMVVLNRAMVALQHEEGKS